MSAAIPDRNRDIKPEQKEARSFKRRSQPNQNADSVAAVSPKVSTPKSEKKRPKHSGKLPDEAGNSAKTCDSDERLKREALAYLRNPNLMRLIVEDVQAAFSISGEETLIEMLYLAVTSRRLDAPLSVILQGESGTGKTHLIDSICRLVPEDEVWTATHMSPKALYYSKESVAHKVINGKERSRLTGPEMQESTSAIRQLLSDKAISNRTVSPERDGTVQEVRGPICYLESTTLNDDSIFKEDLSRALLVRTTSSSEHTRKVLLAIAKRFSSETTGDSDRDNIITKHRVIQGELLEKNPVDIPFREKLAVSFPTDVDATFRLFERLMFCISAITNLHQYQRRKTNRGYLVATENDYRIAKPIMDRCLKDAFCRRLPKSEKAVYEIATRQDEVAASKLVAEAGRQKGIGRTQAFRAIESLIEKGAIAVAKKQGGPKSKIVRCYSLPEL